MDVRTLKHANERPCISKDNIETVGMGNRSLTLIWECHKSAVRLMHRVGESREEAGRDFWAGRGWAESRTVGAVQRFPACMFQDIS